MQEFKTKSHWYIVTELMSEGDLFDYTKKKGYLEEYESALIFKQLVECILYIFPGIAGAALLDFGDDAGDMPESLLLIDILGKSDMYSCGGKNNFKLVRPDHGVIYDAE